MIKVYALGIESCLVGEFNGTLQEAKNFVLNILFVVGATQEMVEQTKENRIDLVTRSTPWREISDIAWKAMEKLCKIGDVRGDPPTSYFFVDDAEQTPSGDYRKIGTFFS